ncbi:MAG TPA: TetR/AcrR family transcriptional regulator [Deltaproteobacteria bacterium]|nr:TetR/AcrR family transcriptional regulator [Deltaproteobacteria bacterium]HOI06437.1 TetR/AcrR family transcriptional regulator [Deltaproteobacteria bacterium]
MKFEAFKESVQLSLEGICRDLLAENRDRIKIKKDEVAVRNLARIFEATLRISNEKGFASMSLRDLSREAGMSMGALYSYISSKEELLDMVQQQGRSLIFRILGERIKDIDDPREKLKAGIQTHLYLSEVVQPWFYFSYMETKNLPKGVHRKAIEAELFTERIFADIIEEGMRKGVFRTVDAQMTSAALKALLQDWYLKRWKHERRKVAVEEYARFVVDLMDAYLGVNEEKGG